MEIMTLEEFKKPVQRSCLIDTANAMDHLAWRMEKSAYVQEHLDNGGCLSDLRSDGAEAASDPLCVRLVTLSLELLRLAEKWPRD